MSETLSEPLERGNPRAVPDRRLAIEARGLVKRFDGAVAVDGVDISVPEGSIFGILGPNGAGKTTTLRMLLGIIDPDAGERHLLGNPKPYEVARAVGYLPEERGLYSSMKAYEAIAFMGALRGLPLGEGRKRGRLMLEEHGLGHAVEKQIRQLSKGMAQTVQLLGTLVHRPRLVVLDEPFSGLDAINQGKLERLIRRLADEGTTVIFSTHVIAHAERLCEQIAIIAGGKVPFAGGVDEARDRIPAQVRLETRRGDGSWRAALPPDTEHDVKNAETHLWSFDLPETGPEPLLRELIEGQAGILSLSIERAGLHDAFVEIAGEAAARALEADTQAELAA
ncbi:ATP-binding cassette domain-containing protein [Altererythrobacter aurantiacus]|uniref:ATP-binding cassette domain-containing protein n=1 Tax=Parapontixanthobacter aurantiacus TaxID=1463599 RepID=A0A844ZEU0_9SPHN|nr:ATP-binding cassette domain-containing protein [Parapontixanthobacter aurantiacus]MXO86064.1 ATP-binding cassette domain-containing protein [Parapontixanthobacter aurantiacus]